MHIKIQKNLLIWGMLIIVLGLFSGCSHKKTTKQLKAIELNISKELENTVELNSSKELENTVELNSSKELSSK